MHKSVVALAGLACAAAVFATYLARIAIGLLWKIVAFKLALLGSLATGLALCGALVVNRQRRLESGRPDLLLVLNRARNESATLGPTARESMTRRWRRRLAWLGFGHRWLVADAVRVKSYEDILATLDSGGCLAGLPFMEEMRRHCGRTARVYRVVDKIYDYGRTSAMRRLNDCVLLTDLRCDGSAHGGCEAACYILWRSEWLEPDPVHGSHIAALPSIDSVGTRRNAPNELCQYTELHAASRAMRRVSWYGLVGPLAVGNLTLSAWLVAMATAAFNRIQAIRGGASFPGRPKSGGVPTPQVAVGLKPGDWVRVRMPGEIAATLNAQSRHKGLWFDADMLKFCGQTFQVRGPVSQIVDAVTGKLVSMKTACITLDNVHCTGELLAFGEQHDYLYWREAWLEPAPRPFH